MLDPQKVIKTNLEQNNKSKITCLLILSFLSFILCVIVACAAAPDIIDEDSMDYNQCSENSEGICFNPNATQNLVRFDVKLSTHNQFFYLQADFDSKNELLYKLRYHLKIDVGKGDKEDVIYNENKTLSIECDHGNCNSVLLFYIPYIEHTNYKVDVKFYGYLTVDKVVFSIKYITYEFTKYYLVVKYFFLALSILAILYFFYKLKTIKFKYMPLEFKILGCSIFSLFIFNEPFLALTLSKLTVGWSGLSVFCNTQFAAFILMFWFLMLQIDYNLKTKAIFTIIELIIVFIFFTLMCVVYMITTVELKYDPTFSWETALPGNGRKVFIAALVLLLILALLMIVHIVYSLIKFSQNTIRRKLMLIMIYLMIFTTFLLIGIGAFQPLPRSGALLLVCISFFNIILFVLSWLYTPSEESISMYLQEKNKKENELIQNPEESNNTILQGRSIINNKV